MVLVVKKKMSVLARQNKIERKGEIDMMKKTIKNAIAIALIVGFAVLALGSMGSSPSSGGGSSSSSSSRRKDPLCNGTGIATNFPGQTGQNPCYQCGGDGYLDPGDPGF